MGQAELFKRAGCEFNVVLGPVFQTRPGSDYGAGGPRYRVLAHKPIGALNLADTYYSELWGPDRPEKQPKIPVEGRHKNKEAAQGSSSTD